MNITVTQQFKLSQPPEKVQTRMYAVGETLDIPDASAAALVEMGVAEVVAAPVVAPAAAPTPQRKSRG